jgi:transcriptional regulator with GAF, ATPase, and Fis domain
LKTNFREGDQMNRPLGRLTDLTDASLADTDQLRLELWRTQERVEWIYGDPLSLLLANQVRQVAPTDASVLICGESGVGKELVARSLHRHSSRADGPLVTVNCAGIPRELFESEFFGHIKGSFTGAICDRVGRFEMADRGTLFLDEISEIPPDLQSKLLRVLQEHQVERIGESRTRPVDVRIVASTNRNIAEEIKAGRFRADLYYRLAVYPIEVPALRQRPRDIPLLAEHFLELACDRFRRSNLRLTPELHDRLLVYPWPGNIRELQNVIERAVISSPNGRLHLSLPNVDKADLGETYRPPALPVTKRNRTVLSHDEIRQLELANIMAALEAADGRVAGPSGAAELLDMNCSTLYSRIKALSISRHAEEPV